MRGGRDEASSAAVAEGLRAGGAAGGRVDPIGFVAARGQTAVTTRQQRRQGPRLGLSPTCQSSEVLVRRGFLYRDQQEENLTGLAAIGSTLSSSRDGRIEIPVDSQVRTNVVRFPKEVT